MKSFSNLSRVLFGVIALSVAVYSFAGHGHKGGDRIAIHKLLENVDVSAEQRQDIKQLARQLRQDIRVFKPDMRAFGSALRELTSAEQFNEQAISQLIADNQNVRQEVALLRARFKNNVWAMLTEEQQEQALEILENQEPKAREFNPERLMKRFEKLDFTEEQIAQAEAIIAQAQTDLAPIKANLATFKEAERALITSSSFTDEAWSELFLANSGSFVQARLVQINSMNQIRDLMTEEQRDKALEFKSKRRHKGRHEA